MERPAWGDKVCRVSLLLNLFSQTGFQLLTESWASSIVLLLPSVFSRCRRFISLHQYLMSSILNLWSPCFIFIFKQNKCQNLFHLCVKMLIWLESDPFLTVAAAEPDSLGCPKLATVPRLTHRGLSRTPSSPPRGKTAGEQSEIMSRASSRRPISRQGERFCLSAASFHVSSLILQTDCAARRDGCQRLWATSCLIRLLTVSRSWSAPTRTTGRRKQHVTGLLTSTMTSCTGGVVFRMNPISRISGEI